jgi:hypothetical protein
VLRKCSSESQNANDEEEGYRKKWLWAFVLRLGKSTKALNHIGRYRGDMSKHNVSIISYKSVPSEVLTEVTSCSPAEVHTCFRTSKSQ